MPDVKVVLDEKKLEKIGKPLIKAINQAQKDGATIDEVLCAMMVMLGSSIRQRGATLNIDAPLREALPPIVHGYEITEAKQPVPMRGLTGSKGAADSWVDFWKKGD